MTETTDVALFVRDNPVVVLTDREKLNTLYADVAKEVAAHVPDLTTKKGRDAIKSLAFKVTRTKTAIDDAGKKLNEDARAQIAKVDEVRREVREKLDALRDEARKPLDEWEEAEEALAQLMKTVLADLERISIIQADATPAVLADELKSIATKDFEHPQYEGWTATLSDARDRAVAVLEAAIPRLIKEEADRAELERLRAAEAERTRKAEEAAERNRQREEEARRREQEADRLAQVREAEAAAAAQAADRARQDAETAAQAQRDADERRHQQELADAQAEARRIQKIEEDRLAAERAAEAQRKAREADQEHRSKIMKAAKEAIMAAGGIDEGDAKLIVLAIAAGNVPYVAMRF